MKCGRQTATATGVGRKGGAPRDAPQHPVQSSTEPRAAMGSGPSSSVESAPTVATATATATATARPATPQRNPARAAHSRFVQRVRRRYPAELGLLPAGRPNRATIDALIERLLEGGRDLASAMRVARHVVLERLAVLDIEQRAAMEDITQSMTELAEATLERALAHACAELDRRCGAPRNASGARIDFWVVGMGKLGARELNVSSDIDLVYVYEEDGATDGAEPISAHEYFSQLARSLYALIGEATDDG